MTQPDRGAVLITILLIVTVMASTAVLVVDDIRFGVKRGTASQAATQSHWYAIGSEMLASGALKQTLALSPDKTDLTQPWAAQSGEFFVPGGLIDGRLSDATGCLNVNSLVTADDTRSLIANETVQPFFADLLRAINLSDGEAEQIISGITDWIDTDSQISQNGAEDFEYLIAVPPYRTANGLIADIATLRAVEAFTPDLYGQLRPFLCAHPTTEFTPININTLDTEHGAVLISALLGEEVTALEATTLLSQRPSAGFERIEDVWEQEILAGKQIPEARRALFDVKSRYFVLNARVIYGETDTAVESLFEIRGGSIVRLVSRQFGEDF